MSHKALLWWQGENDAAYSPDQTIYEARLNAIVDGWHGDTGQKTFIVKICTWIPATTSIRAAQDVVIATNPRVAGWADGDVYIGDVHYNTVADLNAVATAVYNGLRTAFYPGIDLTASGKTLNGVSTITTGSASGISSKSASVSLVNTANAALGSLTGLKWAWFDELTPDTFNAPTDQGSGEVTDGAGMLTVSIPNSVKTSGQTGWLIITDSDGSTVMAHKAFSGPVVVI